MYIHVYYKDKGGMTLLVHMIRLRHKLDLDWIDCLISQSIK